ncbi:methyl-accepting chemotaxis protein I [Cedecea neteri]|uniref:Methyl-accepting chemotaxis protein I n=1 Tax=Cedecea neteri TaxID=158822 RepID=A0A2X3KWE3_9ENTR|nr:methyl-accepting chemotaxis protein I [Cedecea neteri]
MIDSTTQQNSALVEESVAAAASLNDQAKQLRDLVARVPPAVTFHSFFKPASAGFFHFYVWFFRFGMTTQNIVVML